MCFSIQTAFRGFATLAFVLSLSACGGGGGGGQDPNEPPIPDPTVAPTLVRTEPAPDALDARVDGVIRFVFDKPIDPAQNLSAYFELEVQGAPIPFVARRDTASLTALTGADHEATVFLGPQGQLPPDQLVQVRMVPGVAALDGTEVDAPFEFSFTTTRIIEGQSEPNEDLTDSMELVAFKLNSSGYGAKHHAPTGQSRPPPRASVSRRSCPAGVYLNC